MEADTDTTARLRALLEQIIRLTDAGTLRWERQVGSAHRYARWNGNLLILGPADPPHGKESPRYLFITPFDSPACIEIGSTREGLGDLVLKLSAEVERMTADAPATDPFALTDDLLSRLSD